MSRYLRFRRPGGTYFFTVNLARPGGVHLVEQIDLLRQAIHATKASHPFDIDAMVILPDHLHAVWTLPEGDADFSTRWRLIKGRFAHGVRGVFGRSGSKKRAGERGVWQRRFWEHCIRDEADYRAHVAYCWINPVKHGYVQRPVDWPYSTIHRDMRRGLVGSEYVGWVVPDGAAGGVHPPMGERVGLE